MSHWQNVVTLQDIGSSKSSFPREGTEQRSWVRNELGVFGIEGNLTVWNGIQGRKNERQD